MACRVLPRKISLYQSGLPGIPPWIRLQKFLPGDWMPQTLSMILHHCVIGEISRRGGTIAITRSDLCR